MKKICAKLWPTSPYTPSLYSRVSYNVIIWFPHFWLSRIKDNSSLSVEFVRFNLNNFFTLKRMISAHHNPIFCVGDLIVFECISVWELSRTAYFLLSINHNEIFLKYSSLYLVSSRFKTEAIMRIDALKLLLRYSTSHHHWRVLHGLWLQILVIGCGLFDWVMSVWRLRITCHAKYLDVCRYSFYRGMLWPGIFRNLYLWDRCGCVFCNLLLWLSRVVCLWNVVWEFLRHGNQLMETDDIDRRTF